jgi:hypothetical protein
VRFEICDFRHADEILSHRQTWAELKSVIDSIGMEEILAAHLEIGMGRARTPAGGQSAINHVFRVRLDPLGWAPEPRLFARDDLNRWRMDFLKDRVGVEVSFNHAEAIPWTFTRLNIAGESDQVLPGSRIDVGVAIFAKSGLKEWAKMDSAVGTFEIARNWLGIMRPIMPIPILLLGLEADDWPSTDAFRGTIPRANQGPRSAV